MHSCACSTASPNSALEVDEQFASDVSFGVAQRYDVDLKA